MMLDEQGSTISWGKRRSSNLISQMLSSRICREIQLQQQSAVQRILYTKCRWRCYHHAVCLCWSYSTGMPQRLYLWAMIRKWLESSRGSGPGLWWLSWAHGEEWAQMFTCVWVMPPLPQHSGGSLRCCPGNQAQTSAEGTFQFYFKSPPGRKDLKYGNVQNLLHARNSLKISYLERAELKKAEEGWNL